MAETPKLKIPLISGNMNADIPRDMNALAAAVDAKAGVAGGLATLGAGGKVPAGQLDVDTSGLATKTELQAVKDDGTTHKAEDVSLLKKGHAQLNNSVTSTSDIQAATPSAVKKAYDLANGKEAALNANQKRPIYIQSTAPTNPQEGDIWIEV